MKDIQPYIRRIKMLALGPESGVLTMPPVEGKP
jgi:hypothetical protein